jgi:hypothetical protein
LLLAIENLEYSESDAILQTYKVIH